MYLPISFKNFMGHDLPPPKVIVLDKGPLARVFFI